VPDGFGLTRNLWSLRRCPRRSCGHAWPDPAPTDESLPSAYDDYPLHEPERHGGPPPRKPSLPGRAYHAGLKWLGVERRRLGLERFLLPKGDGARLLEVGCGNGSRLTLLRDRGYVVEGQEVAPAGAAAASALGLTVHLGHLESLALPEGAYDILVMNHVLEHVRDPVAFLRQCRRLLRPGGRLVSIQPNGASLAHRVFGPDWVGLDPPRHLHVFTPRSAARVAKDAGFGRVRVATTFVRNEGCTRESLRRRALRRERPEPPSYPAMAFGQVAALAAGLVARKRGDEIVLQGVA
jgi:SAM-dependent methyltransferase